MLSGLRTTPLPAISAGMASDSPVANGKFHGAMMPMTPFGWWIWVDVLTTGTGPPRVTGASSFAARLR